MQVKKLEIKSEVVKITFELGSAKVYDDMRDKNTKDIEALYILAGGYNSHGKHIPLGEYNKMKEVFDSLIQKIQRY